MRSADAVASSARVILLSRQRDRKRCSKKRFVLLRYRWRIRSRCCNIPIPTDILTGENGRVAIVVVGAGAIGLLVAGRLARSGQHTVLLARPSIAAAIEQQG